MLLDWIDPVDTRDKHGPSISNRGHGDQWQSDPAGSGGFMFNQGNVPPPEYRVRPVVRYVVTRYCHPYNHRVESEDGKTGYATPVSGSCKALCEVPSEQGAFDIAEAMAESEGATVQRD